MDQKLAAMALKYVMASSLLSKRALDENRGHREKAAAAEQARPALVDRMVKVGGLDDRGKAHAAELLSKHAGALEVLGYALDQIESLQGELARTKAATLGAPEPEKRASAHAPAGNPNYLGRRSSEMSQADIALMKGLGLPV